MKKIISLILAAALFVPVIASAERDIERDAAPLLSELKIMQGDTDGNLRLDDYVSRAEFAKIAVAASQYKNTVASGMKISPFKDVPYTHWAAPYIQAAVKAGIVSGYMDATFRPDNTVNYEEALTMMLTVLGYSKEDFGASWPYGQIGTAEGLELDKDVNASQGEALTRRQVANLVYNALNTNIKETQNKLISVHDCQIVEDAVITASGNEDASLGSGKIRTTSGVLDISGTFDPDYVGRRGDIAIKNGKDFVAFTPADQTVYDFSVTDVIGSDLVLDGNIIDIGSGTTVYSKSQTLTYADAVRNAEKGDKFKIIADRNGGIEYALLSDGSGGLIMSDNLLDRYVIYSLVGDAAVCYDNGSFIQLDIDDNTPCYRDSAQSTFGAMKQSMAMGDILYVKRGENDIDYVSFEKGNMEGPVKVTSNGYLGGMSVNSETAFMRDGNKVNQGDIKINDIIYYSADLNMVLAYTTKVTGIYENASPSKDSPSSVTISGKTYNVEGADAFNALSSSGGLRYGDTVTVLLGRNGDIAGVMTGNDSTAQYGYVTGAGRKDFTNPDGTTYSSYYVTMITPDGNQNEYTIKNDASEYVGKVCSVSFNGSETRLSSIRSSAAVSGRVNSDSMTIGSSRMAENVRILDTVKSPLFNTTLCKRIFPQRLDGMTLNSSSVIYCAKNSSGEITDMILENATGDAYSYGFALSFRRAGDESYTYTFDVDGTSYTYNTPNLSPGEIGYRLIIENGAVRNISQLKKYNGTSTRLTSTTVSVGGNTYKLSDQVVVYKKSGDTYMKIPLTEAIEKEYKVTAYYDKSENLGGRVRILTAN